METNTNKTVAHLPAKLVRAGLYTVGTFTVLQRDGGWEVFCGLEIAGTFGSWTDATNAARERMSANPARRKPCASTRKAALERAIARAGAVETKRETLLTRVERLAEVLVRYDAMEVG